MRKLFFVVAASVTLMAYSCNDHKNINDQTAGESNVKLEEMPQRIGSTGLASDIELEEMLQTADTTPVAVNSKVQRQKGAAQVSNPNTEWDKKIIKTGTLSVETDNYNRYNNQIHQLVKKWEAYIASEQENSSEYKIENVITIKIPVQYFDDAVQEISSAAPGKLLAKQVNAQDVTADYSDTRARMETKKRIRLRYLDMVQKAKNMEEVLQVEREINALQEQIEGGEGRLRYLGHSAAYSTLQLTFFQVLKVEPTDTEKPSFGTRMLSAITNGLWWFGELIILMFTLWPVWLGIAVMIVVLKRFRKNKITNA